MKRSAPAKRTSGLPKRRDGRSAPTADNLVRQSQLFDIAQDAIFVWSDAGGIQFWNRGATELYGYTSKQAFGREIHKLLKTKFPVPLAEIEEKLRKTGSWYGELRQLTRTGKELVVSSRFQRVPHAGKEMIVLECTRDITEAKRTEQLLRSRLREQAVVARFSLDALQATNIQTVCDDATHVLVREMGGDFSSLFELQPNGRTLLLRSGDGWKPGHVGVTRLDLGEQTVTGRALQLNQPILIEDIRKDQHLRLPAYIKEHRITSSMAVVIQGRERPFGVLTVDTTARRTFKTEDIHFLEAIGNVVATAISRLQFEHELRNTAARLKAIVETAVDGIITIDEQGIVETMNPAAERIFGFAADEVVGKNVSILMPEPYRSEHDGYLARYRRTGERRIIGIGREVRGRRRNGTEFPLDLSVSATSLGTRRIFTGVVRDISVRKKLEQQVLEISEQEKRRLGSDLHDDLCQRLASIRFQCDALRNSLSKTPIEATRDRLGKISTDVGESVDRARMLARGLAPVALDKGGLVSALEELTASTQAMSRVKCAFRAKERIGIRNPLVATHLFRIAQEAVNNALKHGTPKTITVSLRKRDGTNILTIQDDGDGFAVEKVHGALGGMGLRTISYRAAMIGANVEIDSKIGRGTKIIVRVRSDL